MRQWHHIRPATTNINMKNVEAIGTFLDFVFWRMLFDYLDHSDGHSNLTEASCKTKIR